MKKTILSILLATALCACAGNSNRQPAETAAATTEEKTDTASAEPAQEDGQSAPDFTLNDINGNPLSLSSLRGKYVVLDFWGSWCVWCIKGIPEMKKYYEKYQGKFEILGIDCNDSEEKWKAAVKKYELPWLHVYNTETSGVLEKYEIQGFPTKIVISPEGNIVKTVIGEDPAFYTFLDQLFK
jgi:thiol-disulfide isomerase/thioredoxin